MLQEYNTEMHQIQMCLPRSRGYMFVEYESHKAAAVARRKLSQGKQTQFDDNNCQNCHKKKNIEL